MSSLRWTLAMVLLASCTRSETALPATFRAPGMPETGPAVARVLVFKGTPQVVAGGQGFQAQQDLQVQEGDLLRVPAQSWLVLRIDANGYVVNVDEDLELAVKDLALLKAPPTKQTIEQQLEAMQASREAGADRVTAYQNRRTAGQGATSAAAKAEESAPRRKAVSSFEGAPAAPPAPAPMPAAAAQAKAEPPAKSVAAAEPAPEMKAQRLDRSSKKVALAQPEPEAEAQKGGAIGGGADKAKEMKTEEEAVAEPPAPQGPSWELVTNGVAQPQARALPPAVAEALGDLSAVKVCLQRVWSAQGLPTAGATDTLLLRSEGGKVTRVRLGSGLAAGGCAAALLDKATGLDADGWIRIRVALE